MAEDADSLLGVHTAVVTEEIEAEVSHHIRPEDLETRRVGFVI